MVTVVAAVFDCDGTIADTESLAERAWAEVLRDAGYEPKDADFRAIIGRPFAQNWDYFRRFVDLGSAEDVVARLRARYTTMFAAGLDLYPDAVTTIRAVVDGGGVVGVASSSRHAHVVAVLERAGIDGVVDVVVGADDVIRHKPDPTPYQRAVDLLGVLPQEATAVEDTAVGVASATGAGLFTVAVRRRGTSEGLDGAHRIVDVLTIDALRRDHAED